jgi:hypothetical protein
LDEAVRSAKTHGADIIVAPFNDAIGRDAIVEWPGGVRMQLYWHTSAQSYAKLQTVPENRVYVSPDRVDAFVLDFVAFSSGRFCQMSDMHWVLKSDAQTTTSGGCASPPILVTWWLW